MCSCVIIPYHAFVGMRITSASGSERRASQPPGPPSPDQTRAAVRGHAVAPMWPILCRHAIAGSQQDDHEGEHEQYIIENQVGNAPPQRGLRIE